jgi:hypothetical protein
MYYVRDLFLPLLLPTTIVKSKNRTVALTRWQPSELRDKNINQLKSKCFNQGNSTDANRIHCEGTKAYCKSMGSLGRMNIRKEVLNG